MALVATGKNVFQGFDWPWRYAVNEIGETRYVYVPPFIKPILVDEVGTGDRR